MVGGFHGMLLYSYLRNIQDLLSDGKTPYERRFGIPFKGGIIPFSSMVEYHPILPKTCRDCIQQISELQFGKFPSPQTFLVWKIRFKNQVTTCYDFPSDTVLWIKEVEMVDSSDEYKSSQSIVGKNFQN